MKTHDPYEVWNNGKYQFTLKKICEITGTDENSIPEKFQPVKNTIINRVTADNMPARSGIRVLFDLSWNKTDEESRPKITEYIRKGVIVFSNRTFTDSDGTQLDTIYTGDPWEAWVALGKYVKKLFPMPTVAITGSAGKTTCTMFAQCVFNERYNVFISGEDGKNFNTPLQIVNQWILRANSEFDFHIQECGGETPDLIKTSARIIEPDAFAINNIDTTQHIATYGTPEKLIEDKTSFDRVRKDNTFGVINLDDKILKDFKFNSPVITYAINDKTADFVAENIKQNGKFLEFNVVSADETVPIKINIIGDYNVYNALMVFALAKKFGLTNEEIQSGFLKYKSVGIRQNLQEVAGRLLYMDCYNASVESTTLAVKTLSELTTDNGRRIAVIGERKAANEDIYKINYELGQKLAQYKNIDEFICITEDPSMVIGEKTSDKQLCATYDGIKANLNSGQKVSLCDDLIELAEKLKYQTRKGDVILFKGRATLALWCIPDLAFGTWYTKSSVLMPLGLAKKTVSSKEYKGEYLKYYGGINLQWGQNGFDNTQLIIPNVLEDYQVVRINNGMFKNNSQIRRVVFGTNVKSVGNEAFYNCVNLEEALIPLKCVYLGERAFCNCTDLVRVSALKVQHISTKAFKCCTNLKEILLSESCMTIEEDAFAGCRNVTIKAPKGSYAFNYACEHGINVEEIDSSEELFKTAANGTSNRPNIYSLALYSEKYDQDSDGGKEESDHLTVAFTGDIMAHDIHLKGFFDKETGLYNFDKLFQNTAPYLTGADIAVGNVETTFGPGAYTAFPRFNTPEYLAESMKSAGFDVAAVANNHMFDSGYAGIIRTKKILKQNGMSVTGVKDEDTDRNYSVVEKKGIKVAILNYTYRTYDVEGKKTLNQHVLDDRSSNIVNTFSCEHLDKDLRNIGQDMLKAKEEADVILVYYHWGNEYETKANVLQKYVAYQTAKMGADAIIGSHAHVIQEEDKIEVNIDGNKKNVPVFYGLGNYCWGGRLPRTGRETVQNGMIAFLDIKFDRSADRAAIETSYLPLYIKNDFIRDKYDFSILSLNDMTELQRDSFNRHNAESCAEIISEIESQLHPAKLHDDKDLFDEPIVIGVGEKADILEKLNIERNSGELFSENAIIASALQSGEIIGNKPGMTGMKYVSENGETVKFVVQVNNENNGIMPTLINKYNTVADIYRPKVCAGNKYYLPGISLEEEAANAWKTMYLYAAANRIGIKAVRGFETNEVQLKSRIKKAEQHLDVNFEHIEIKTDTLGSSYHNLGTAIDVSAQSGEQEDITSAVNWIEKNAYKFGFAVAKTEDDVAHMLFVKDPDVAWIIQSLKGDVERFIEKNEHYQDVIDRRKMWEHTYIDEIEKLEPKSKWSELTLKRICEIIGIEVPVAYRDVQDRVVPQITLTDMNMKKGSVFFYDGTLKMAKAKCRNALRRSAALAVTDEIIKDEIGNYVNQIIVDNSFEACAKVCRYLLEKNQCKVIAIEEKNDGKECLKILNNILSARYNIMINSGISNGRPNMVEAVQKVTGEHDYFLQEIEGAFPDFIKENMTMLAPAISVITGLKENYPLNYISREEYEKDALSVIKATADNGGVTIVNIDEPALVEYAGRPDVRTISMKSKQADYCFLKFRQRQDYIDAAIKLKELNDIINIRISSEYADKAVSVLAAYAAGDVLGLTEQEILQSSVSKMGVVELSDEELDKLKNSIKIISEKKAIFIQWQNVLSDVTGYHVRCYDSNGKMLKGMHVYDGNSYRFTGLDPGSDYIIKIRGYIIDNGYKSYGSYVSMKASTEEITDSDKFAENDKKGDFFHRIKRKNKKIRKDMKR